MSKDETINFEKSGTQNTVEDKRQDLKKRLKQYALRVIRLYESSPKTGAVHILTHQLLRSGTSPGARYAEACRAKSNADFFSKIEGALQELEESLYWLDWLCTKIRFLRKPAL
jgi:four helix bundle protein